MLASTASRRTRSRPFCRSRCTRNHHCPAKRESTRTPPRRLSSWAVESAPSQERALGPAPPSEPAHRTNPAMAARAPLRARVFHPAGAECSCPKQWHSGLRPRARLTVMPTRNTERSASAPRAPHQAVDAGKRGAASDEGRPKSTMACREPSRSVSLATPATAKTRASSKRVTNRAAYNNPSPFPLGPPGLLTATRDSVVYDAASLTCGAADMFKAITPAGATYLARTTAVSKAARLERSLARIHWARERGRTGGESRARGTANSRGIAGTRRHHDDAPAVLALLVSRALGRRLARHAACNRGARAHAAGADVVLGARVVIVAG